MTYICYMYTCVSVAPVAEDRSIEVLQGELTYANLRGHNYDLTYKYTDIAKIDI